MDAGFAWIVVFASFMIHFISDGVAYTFGIFYNEFVKHFHAGKGPLAWVPSIMTAMTYLIGPVASGLTNKYGCRAITIVGAILSSLGLLLGAISTNVILLCLTIGVITGAGLGLIYLPAIVIVTCYFEKRRAFATGIAVSGSGVGSAVMAPLTEWLIDLYGWRGGMVIISGLLLNCCVFGCLLRPLEDTIDESKQQQQQQQQQQSEQKQEVDDKLALTSNIGKLKGFLDSNSDDNKRIFVNPTDTNHNLANNDSHQSLILSKTFSPSHHSINSYYSTVGQMKSDQSTGNRFICTQHPEDECPSNCGHKSLTREEESSSSRRKHSISSSSGILYRKDIFYSASLTNLQHHQSNSLTASFSNVNDLIMDEKNYVIHKKSYKSNPLFACCPGKNRFICGGKEIRDTLSEMMDVRLLGNLIFLIFSISNLLTSLGYYVPNIYIKDRSIFLKIASNHEASILLAIIGISSSVGRLLFGFISDLKSINRLKLFSCCLTFSGLSTIISCFFTTYPLMALYCAFYGLTCGAYVSLTTVVIVDLLGLEKLTNAFGLVLLFQGFGCLVGPPVVGWSFDLTKSYTPGFLWAGSMITLSGLILFIIPCLNKRNSSRLPKTPLVVINTKDI